jgi:uroporphyrinogen decarboxylase
MNAKENLLKAINRDNPEYIPWLVRKFPHLDQGIIKRVEYIGNFTGMGIEGTDDWGVHWVPSEGYGKDMVCFPKVHPLEDITDLNNYRFPDTSKFELDSKSIKTIGSVNKDEVIIFGQSHYCLFERAWALTGLENFLVYLYTEPKLVKKLIKGIGNYHIKMADHYINLGVDGCRVSEDLGSQRQLLMNPDQWREFFKPELKRIVEKYKKAGKLFFFHSCGHIEDIVEDLIEIGVDILNPVQAGANDLQAMGEQFGGRITFLGGIDSQHVLMLGTPEEVVAETRLRIKQLSPGGGYIAAPDQSMPFPEANIKAMVDTVKKYGKYPIEQ